MGNFRELVVWQRSRTLVKSVYEFTALLPISESYGLVSQIQRAAVSIPANIAEGSARGTDREFNRFALIALGSAAELETLVLLAADIGYVRTDASSELLSSLNEIQIMLRRLSKSLSQTMVREASTTNYEPASDYPTDPTDLTDPTDSHTTD